MKVKNDETEVGLTPRFIAALIEAMKAECEMMAAIDGDPKIWAAGRCYIRDLSSSVGITRRFGPRSEFANDGLGDFAVVPGDGRT